MPAGLGSTVVARAGAPDAPASRPHVFFLGAFPSEGSGIVGGNASACGALMRSSFAQRLRISTLDSSQPVPAPPFAMRALVALGRAARFGRRLRRERPDAMLVFCSSGFSFLEKALYVRMAARRGIPSLLFIRSGHFRDLVDRSPRFRRVAGRLLRSAALLPCQGPRWQHFYRDRFGIDPGRCPLVENWLSDDRLLAIGATRRPAPDAAGPVTILYLGWIERFKGVFDLLDAVATLVREPSLPAFRVVVAGDGSALDEARARAATLGIEERVEFAGWLTGEAREANIRDADMLVLPSHTEGLPNAMVEAMAAGLPVVVTPVGSIPDVVEDGRTGCLVPARSPERLTGALAALVRDGEARIRIGRAAHEAAAARFSTERAAGQLVALIQQVTHTGGPLPDPDLHNATGEISS